MRLAISSLIDHIAFSSQEISRYFVETVIPRSTSPIAFSAHCVRCISYHIVSFSFISFLFSHHFFLTYRLFHTAAAGSIFL
mmetsp:Transcript_15318/g.31333  ORF Transcript_15318/g.31333 Transcript_15318/m.31333 type:complete len:81 (-) Transcript_15318:770-1012(-)